MFDAIGTILIMEDDPDRPPLVEDWRFITSHTLKKHGYDEPCPIVAIHRRVIDDGSSSLLVGEYGDALLFEEDFLPDVPGFLVLHLAGLDDDPTVEKAATALHAALQAMLITCGSDVDVRYERIRTALEVQKFMEVHRWRYSHVILIGHGGPEGLRFIDREEPVAKAEYARLLGCNSDCRRMQVISLCCHSGCEDMAAELSRDDSVSEVIAPDGTFDVRWSTVFVLAYVLKVFDEGYSPEQATSDLKFGQPLCVWRDGERLGCDSAR